MSNTIIQLKDKQGNNNYPITHVNAIRDSEGNTLPEIIEDELEQCDVAFLHNEGETVILPEYVPGIFIGTCSTAADTAAKTLDIDGYGLVRKGGVAITFTNGISVANATLNISSKGAKPIYYRGAALAAGIVRAGDIVTMVYDGTQYVIISIESVPVYKRIYKEVSNPTGNPVTNGWYELSNGEYVLSEDTTVTSGKTYYI